MGSRERGGPRITYHPRTRGALVLPVFHLPKDSTEFDDDGKVVRRAYPIAGGSESLPTEKEKPIIGQERATQKLKRP